MLRADILKAVIALGALQAFAVPDDDAQAEAQARQIADRLGMKFGDMMMTWRVAVTGSKVSPPLFPSLRLIGRAGVEGKVKAAVGLLLLLLGC